MGRGNKEGFNQKAIDPEFRRELERLAQQPTQRGPKQNPLLNSLDRIYGSNQQAKPDVFGRRPATGREIRDAIDRKKSE
ncbi:MAG TPA: hypothetical protein VG917_03505 [Patescibacteria group bacterium]|nr:hypothetical protein [Patescibacteria group bacterium]